MKRIIVNTVIFIILVFSAFTVVEALEYRTTNADFTACALEGDSGSYFLAGSVMGEDLIYKVSSSGKVTDLYNEKYDDAGVKLYNGDIEDICCSDGIYYIAGTTDYDGTYYLKLVKLSEGLRHIKTIYASDFAEGMRASKLTIAGSKAYVTLLTADRKSVYVYSMDMSSDDSTWSLLKIQDASDGRYFIEAVYTGTVIQAGLDNGSYVFYDADSEKTLTDDSNLLLSKTETLAGHQISMSSFGIMLRAAKQVVLQNFLQALICVVFAVMLYLMFTSRYYALKQFALIDLAFAVLVIASITFCIRINAVNIKKTYMDDVQLNFDYFNREYSSSNAYFLDATDYFNSDDYCKAYDELADFADRTGYVKEMVLLYKNGKNEQVLASLNTYRTAAASKIITARIEEMIAEANSSSKPVYEAQKIMGEEYGVYVTPLRDSTLISKYIVSVVSLSAANRQSSSFKSFMILMAFLVFAVTTFGAAVTVRSMTKDIREFGKAMMEDTEDAVKRRKPSVNNNEIEYMWNALTELTKRYESVNYSKYQVMQAYYRFAPRRIEEVLGKDSIVDVKIGDLVHVHSTMALISLGEARNVNAPDYMISVDHDLATIGTYQSSEGGIIVSKNSDLTYIKMLFPEGAVKAERFAAETLQAFRRENDARGEELFVMLHSDDFLYGVTGNEEQTFPFTVSAASRELDGFIEQFRKAHTGMVVTETVDMPDALKKESRYIGYLTLKATGKDIKVYQILDVLSVRQRNRLLEQDALFQKALSAFSGNGFYEARNGFTEILKNNSEDEIARWYLFECEKYLNNPDNKDYHYGLFS